MSLNFEVFLAIVLTALILLFATTVVLLMIFLPPRIQQFFDRVRFPIQVPGWKTRLSAHPPFLATVDDINVLHQAIVRAAEGRLDTRAVRRKLDGLKVLWVAYDEAATDRGYQHHILDPWGRRNSDGSSGYVSGYHQGDGADVITVVVRPDYTLIELSYLHEALHEVQELVSSVPDREHSSRVFWGLDGLAAEAKRIYLEAQHGTRKAQQFAKE